MKDNSVTSVMSRKMIKIQVSHNNSSIEAVNNDTNH